jgi:hypothetical protein
MLLKLGYISIRSQYKKEPVLRKKKKNVSLNKKKNMVQVHGGTKASAEEGRYINTQTN